VSQTESTAAAEEFAARHGRWNFAMVALDYGFYNLGMSFVAITTITAALAQRLGAPNLVIGAIPAVMSVGYALPTLFTANYTERLPRKLPFILLYTVWERVPLLFVALAVYFLGVSAPSVVLVVLLASLALVFSAGGALTPAWMDLIAKVVKPNRRGRVFAIGSTLGALLGLVGARVSEHFLQAYDYPLSYALCFATGFAFLMVSFGFIAMVKEPQLHTGKPRLSFRDYARRLPAVLRDDRHFAWFLVYRCLISVAGMASGFYTVFALRELAVPEWEVARFTFVTLLTIVIATIALGWVGDHAGHRLVLAVSGVAMVVANVLAYLATGVEAVYVVFAANAVSLAGATVSMLTMSMEFAPETDRPTYIGLAGTLTAPFAAVAPLVGGALADAAGYGPVFVLAAALSVFAVLTLVTRVADPRMSRRAAGTTIADAG